MKYGFQARALFFVGAMFLLLETIREAGITAIPDWMLGAGLTSAVLGLLVWTIV